MAKEIIAGISIADNVAHVAVFEVRNSETKLLHLDEFQNTTTDSFWYLSSVLNPDLRALKKVTKVSVALDVSSVILHSFPMDTSLTQTEQNEHVHWELSNFVEKYQAREYVYDLHPLRINSREQVADVLAVAVKQSLLREIQDTLGKRKLELHIADLSYFGAQQSLWFNYPEFRPKSVALIVTSATHFEIGIENNGRTVNFGYGKDVSTESIKKVLNQQLENVQISEMYCCGPKVTTELLNSLRNTFQIKLHLLDPFRRTVTKFSYRDYDVFRGREHLFAASTGVALRK